MKRAGPTCWLVIEAEIDGSRFRGWPRPELIVLQPLPGGMSELGSAFRASSAARPAGPPAFKKIRIAGILTPLTPGPLRSV
jgi:hypothetical protein